MALSIQPLEVEEWLSAVKEEELLQNPTLDKMRRVMSLVYKHGQRYGLISRREESNPLRFVRCKTMSDYEAVILSPEQAFAILVGLPDPEKTLTLLAASTGLRISECLGLQWQDVNFNGSLIHVRRTWTCGKVGLPKSKSSQAPVPMHSLLAEFMRAWQMRTPYRQPEDWVFPGFRLGGSKPRAANMLVEDYLRPAAIKAGVIPAGDPCRFGFHNLRFSLASFLVRSKTDPKTVQALLRHSDVMTTLQLYAHSVSTDPISQRPRNRKMDRLSFLLSQGQGARKERLLFGAEELLRFQFVLASIGAPQEPEVERDNILLVRIDAIESRGEVIKRVVVADHHQHIAWPDSESLRSQVVARLYVELIELGTFTSALAGHFFRDLEDREEDDCEGNAGNRRDLFGKEIDSAKRD